MRAACNLLMACCFVFYTFEVLLLQIEHSKLTMLTMCCLCLHTRTHTHTHTRSLEEMMTQSEHNRKHFGPPL